MNDNPSRTVGTAGLDAHLRVSRGSFDLDLPLTVAAGEVVALLGPNGAGKTTALRTLAGLLPLTDGHIVLSGQSLDDGRSTFVRPERRSVGVVFQDYLLFPHLSALENVAFGPRSRGVPRAQAREAARQWLERVGLGELARHRPRQLSGGQAQRVALARALAVSPQLLLLDEPLAALDARTRLDTRASLHRHLAEHIGPTLIVTHDPVDAFMLADRLVIVESGRIVQTGTPAEVTATPRTDYVARLVGLNLYRGQGAGRTVRLPSGFEVSTSDDVTGDAFVAFPPAAVALYVTAPEGSPRNTWEATVDGVTRHGDNLRVRLVDGRLGEVAADVTPSGAAALRLEPGQRLWAVVKATETHAYPA